MRPATHHNPVSYTHLNNCVSHVTEALLEIDGVAGADVVLEPKTATVTLEKEIADEVLKLSLIHI